MKKIIFGVIFLFLAGVSFAADTATPTKTPTATHTPTITSTPTMMAALNDGGVGKGKLGITVDKWNFLHNWPSDLNGLPQVYSVPLTPTPTQTPTITPTVHPSSTPIGANQYTATPTKTLEPLQTPAYALTPVSGSNSFQAGTWTVGVSNQFTPVPQFTAVPQATVQQVTVNVMPTINPTLEPSKGEQLAGNATVDSLLTTTTAMAQDVLALAGSIPTPISGIYTVPTPASTAVPVTFFIAPANSYIFEMTLVAGSTTILGDNVLTRASTFGSMTYPATIAPGVLEDFNKNPWCLSAATTFSVLESEGGGTMSYSGFQH